MRVFLFRASLKQRTQKDAFERQDQHGDQFTRESWLQDVFSTQFSFSHQGNEFFFVPESTKQSGLPHGLIVGWIARDKPKDERTPPWEGLKPTEHHSWQAALFLMDPSAHQDGQKLAFEHQKDVGGPEPVLASLAQYLTDLGPQEPFSVQIYPIIQERSFARFAAAHRGKIHKITYDVAAPN